MQAMLPGGFPFHQFIIKAVHQWWWKMPHHWRHLAPKRNSIFKCKQHNNIYDHRGQNILFLCNKENVLMSSWSLFHILFNVNIHCNIRIFKSWRKTILILQLLNEFQLNKIHNKLNCTWLYESKMKKTCQYLGLNWKLYCWRVSIYLLDF